MPDGIAFDTSGRPLRRLLPARPHLSRVVRAALEVLADDPLGIDLNTPTNMAFAGERPAAHGGGQRRRGGICSIGDVGVAGLPLNYPEVP